MTRNIIFLTFIFALIAGLAGFYFRKAAPPEITEPDFREVRLSAAVKGCAETEEGMAAKAVGEGIEQEAKLEVEGNRLAYSRAINHLCCRKAVIEKEIGAREINLYEVWSGVGCRCMCFSEIEASLENLPAGSYSVKVYEKGTEPISGEAMEPKLIHSQTITVE